MIIMSDKRKARLRDDQVQEQRVYSKDEARRIIMEVDEREEKRQKNYTKADENRLQEEVESNSGGGAVRGRQEVAACECLSP